MRAAEPRRVSFVSTACRMPPDMRSWFDRTSIFRQSAAAQWELSFERYLEGQKLTDMKMEDLFTAAIVSAGLAFSIGAQARGKKHEEQTISSSDVPSAVQQAAQADGTIVRWEKEGANYEAVIEKNGKQTGVEMDAYGKIVSRDDEAKEHKEKGEKH